jgi:hypothetical protein
VTSTGVGGQLARATSTAGSVSGRWRGDPAMLVTGFLVGSGWAVPVGGVFWGVWVMAGGRGAVADLPLAVAVGGANAAIGLIARRAFAWPVRRLIGWAR